MAAHVSILNSNHSPHKPHAHAEEESLIILDGEAELVIQATADLQRRSWSGCAVALSLTIFCLSVPHHSKSYVSTNPVFNVQMDWMAEHYGESVTDHGH